MALIAGIAAILSLTAPASAAEGAGLPGATGARDMGKVMAELKAKYAGRMDFGRASGWVKELLQ